jgi:hypothetical protein
MTTPELNELEVVQAKTALRLMHVIPLAFPEHVLIRHLKNELRLAQEACLIRGWEDNNPCRVREEIIVFNRVTEECGCEICRELTQPLNMIRCPSECRIWGRITWYMSQAGLSTIFGSGERFFLMKAVHTGRLSDMFPVSIQPDERPAGFDELTACPYMGPVSHLDVHVVFRRRGNAYEFVYGRKLWDHRTFDNQEIRKLDLFRARLRSAWSGF